VLPGVGTLYQGQTLRFHDHARVGDELTATVRVTEKKPKRVVVLETRVSNQSSVLVADGYAEVIAPEKKLELEAHDLPNLVLKSHQHFDRLLDIADDLDPLPTAVVCPEEEKALGGAMLARERGLIEPLLVGASARIRETAEKLGKSLSGIEIIEAADHGDAGAKAVALVHAGRASALMKGYLHTDELLRHVVESNGGLRTSRRVSHAFVMDVPGLSNLLLITDAAINILPTLEDKVDIVQNAIDLAIALGIPEPGVAVLSAVETVNTKIPSTLDAAILSKMAERGQIKGGIVDGPLAMDNAIDIEAARTKGVTSLVAGRAEVLVAPNMEAGNMLAKELTFIAHAEAPGKRFNVKEFLKASQHPAFEKLGLDRGRMVAVLKVMDRIEGGTPPLSAKDVAEELGAKAGTAVSLATGNTAALLFAAKYWIKYGGLKNAARVMADPNGPEALRIIANAKQPGPKSRAVVATSQRLVWAVGVIMGNAVKQEGEEG